MKSRSDSRKTEGRQGRQNIDMTQGSIPGLLARFALPLLLGNLFQLLYNIVDSWVVGNFVSNEAFSAVGSVSPIINTLVCLFLGLSSGASVVISQYFGARRNDDISRTAHSAMVLTVYLSIAVTVIGLLLRDPLLALMNTPESVLPDARTYLTIYISGVAGLLFYNMAAAILESMGDSKKPFLFLVVSTILNIIGDLFFVLVLKKGVAGVAIATILTQAISAFLAVFTLFRTDTAVRLSFHKMHMDPEKIRQIVRIGIPAAIQDTVISFSNIIVQRYINYFGPDAMSGWTAYLKVDTLLLLPMQSIGLSITTFVGQNIGVGRTDRIKKGVNAAILMNFIATFIPAVFVMIFAPQLVSFFNAKPEVVKYGTEILHVITPFYVLTLTCNIHLSAVRGAGNARAPMVILIFSYVVFRQIYLYIMANYISNTLIPIVLGYPLGWIVSTVISFVYYCRADLGRASVVQEKS